MGWRLTIPARSEYAFVPREIVSPSDSWAPRSYDHRAQVAKRIDIFAAALHCELRVDQLLDLDLSYTPPFAAPWDAVQVAAQKWLLT